MGAVAVPLTLRPLMLLHALTDGSLVPPPGVAVPLAATAALYVRGLGRTRRRRPRTAAFVGGWTVLGVALATPLHGAGQSWLSAHMLQHMLLMSLAAPLLVWSRPGGILLRGLPDSARGLLIQLLRRLQPALHRLTGIGVACALQAVLLWLWHAPAFYTRTLSSELVHDAQHLTLLGGAFLFWASIEPAFRRRGVAGLAVLSLFVTTLHTSVLAALLTFSRVVWYAPYAWSPDALADQQLAGLIMWVPGALPYVGAALAVLWLALQEPAQVWRSAASPVKLGVALLLLLTGACGGGTDPDREIPAGRTVPPAAAAPAPGTLPQEDGEWRMAAKDYANSRFSGLSDIHAGNVAGLRVAWTFSTGVPAGHEAAPLVVGGTVFVVSPFPNSATATSTSWTVRPVRSSPPTRSTTSLPTPVLTWRPGGCST